jgi:DNA invertase Pin-like site-specific DNA recombinase
MSEYVMAKYIRLSIEDEKTDSMSISNQRKLLDRYIEEMEIPNAAVLEFVDNGHSGTNMERPAVQEMLDLVRSGRVQCIAVKDFSRFSRNAMDSGYFVEQVFPLYRVRFIAVNDGFDSDDYKNDTGGIDVAFKFLMHEYYSQDLSIKIKSAKRIQMARGENIVARAIFGYHKKNGVWTPDEPAAAIVREIFCLALQGRNTAEIRDVMTAKSHPTPSRYLAGLHRMKTAQSEVWTTQMALAILKNIQYTGTYVAGKQEPRAVGSRSAVSRPKETWIQIPDKHESIVSKEDFGKVQELLKRFKGSRVSKPINSLLDDKKRCKREKMVSGERLPNNAIYGYAKNADGSLRIDDAVANIVREMFEMAAQGVTVKGISGKLSDAGHPTPGEYIKRGRSQTVTLTRGWTDKCVRNTLKNIQYTGAYVSGKILLNHETGKRFHTPESDWVVIPDKYPAIVSRELFDKVKEILAVGMVGHKNCRPRDYLLKGGFVKCGCCGYSLSYDDSARNIVYRCPHTLADKSADCHKMKINAAELDEAVLTVIRKQAEALLNTSDLSQLRYRGADDQRAADIEKQIRECVEQRQRDYERFILRDVDREEYRKLKADCSVRLDRLNGQLAVLKQVERDKQLAQKSSALAKEVLSESMTPREIVEALIEKVLVFPNDHIEIQWKIADFANNDEMREKIYV